MKIQILVAGAVLALSAAAGPALASPPDFEHMSLPDTLGFLQGAIMSQGKIAWQGNVHDSNDGQDWSYQRSVEFTNFRLDASACTFIFHYTVITDGKVSTEVVDGGIPFKMVNAVETTDESQRVGKNDAQVGHPTWSSRTSPEIYVVDIFRTDGQENVLSFYDKGVADQAADAVEHARALCRG